MEFISGDSLTARAHPSWSSALLVVSSRARNPFGTAGRCLPWCTTGPLASKTDELRRPPKRCPKSLALCVLTTLTGSRVSLGPKHQRLKFGKIPHGWVLEKICEVWLGWGTNPTWLTCESHLLGESCVFLRFESRSFLLYFCLTNTSCVSVSLFLRPSSYTVQPTYVICEWHVHKSELVKWSGNLKLLNCLSSSPRA